LGLVSGSTTPKLLNTHNVMDIQLSFTITFVSLLLSAILNGIESIRTTLPHVRHILSLETCIALVAAYFYSIFKSKSYSDWSKLTQLRYLDWAFTTPMMLLGLCLFLAFNSKTTVGLFTYLGIVVLDYFMLYFGYLGETKQMDRMSADIIGFLGYIGIFVIIFKNFVKNNKINYIVFSAYAIIWAMYGFVYFLDEYNKNLIMNWLDLIAKSLIGICLWAYFTNVLKQ
jgi:bacteriorhodopsin